MPDVPALAVEGLTVRIRGADGDLAAVSDLSFDVWAGRTLCLVGESGCGKTMTALSILGLQPDVAAITAGRVRLDGRDLLTLSRSELENVRGDRIAMIFQEPMTSLNPVVTIGDQIVETLRRHRPVSRRQARARAVETLALVGLPAPDAAAQAFPHQMSGGMRQRAMIAMALACEPRVLIADEPTTALDVTIQAGILALLRDLQARLGMALVLITHDLGVVAEIADDVVVMYAGRAVESAPVRAFFDASGHPYTRGLMRATPRRAAGAGDIPEIPGIVPPLWALPVGCAFAPRCGHAVEACRAAPPPLAARAGGRHVACFEADRIAAEPLHA